MSVRVFGSNGPLIDGDAFRYVKSSPTEQSLSAVLESAAISRAIASNSCLRLRKGAKSAGMKKGGSVVRGENQTSNNEQVLAEMQVFLLALTSYPDRFAVDPEVSFEEHCSRIMQVAHGGYRNRC